MQDDSTEHDLLCFLAFSLFCSFFCFDFFFFFCCLFFFCPGVPLRCLLLVLLLLSVLGRCPGFFFLVFFFSSFLCCLLLRTCLPFLFLLSATNVPPGCPRELSSTLFPKSKFCLDKLFPEACLLCLLSTWSRESKRKGRRRQRKNLLIMKIFLITHELGFPVLPFQGEKCLMTYSHSAIRPLHTCQVPCLPQHYSVQLITAASYWIIIDQLACLIMRTCGGVTA